MIYAKLLSSCGLLFCAASLAVMVTAVDAHADSQLQPFQSDGCSAFPDGTPEQQNLWLDCCTEHDRAYWLGGTYQQRVAADERMRQCVEQAGEPEIGMLMLLGVRVGGSAYWPMPYRWGYGWPYPRTYGPLTVAEQIEVEQRKSNK